MLLCTKNNLFLQPFWPEKKREMLIWWSLRRRWNKGCDADLLRWSSHLTSLLLFISRRENWKILMIPDFLVYPHAELQRHETKRKVFKNTLYTPAKKRVKKCSLKKIVFVLSHKHTLINCILRKRAKREKVLARETKLLSSRACQLLLSVDRSFSLHQNFLGFAFSWLLHCCAAMVHVYL